jgi:hypothetical protein
MAYDRGRADDDPLPTTPMLQRSKDDTMSDNTQAIDTMEAAASVNDALSIPSTTETLPMKRLEIVIGKGDDKIRTSVQVSTIYYIDNGTIAPLKADVRNGTSEEASIARGMLADLLTDNRPEARAMLRQASIRGKNEGRYEYALRRAALVKASARMIVKA